MSQKRMHRYTTERTDTTWALQKLTRSKGYLNQDSIDKGFPFSLTSKHSIFLWY
jgi:hypothetical protein